MTSCFRNHITVTLLHQYVHVVWSWHDIHSQRQHLPIALGMRGIKKSPTIIYRLKKYRDTDIPRYLVTSSMVDNFCKNPSMRIICTAVVSPILFAIMLLILCVNLLSLDVFVMLLTFMLKFWCMLMTCCWSHLRAVMYIEWQKFVRMRWSNLFHDESILKISTAGRYTAVFSKPTVYNTVTF